MTDQELIGYCEIHSKTQRALFSLEQINRMIELAGYPENFVRRVYQDWLSVKEPMEELCRLARQRTEGEIRQ